MCSEEEGVPMILLFTILCVILLAITSVAFVFLLRDTACDNKDDFQERTITVENWHWIR